MGSFCSTVTDEDKQSVFVDGEIATARTVDKRIKKLLLLGAGGSGKSTFFKQLQTIHGPGFDDKDRLSFQKHIYHQIVEQMKRLISRADEFSEDFPEEYGDCKIGAAANEAAEYFDLLRDDAPVTEEVAQKVEILWADSGIKNAFAKRAKFGVTDSTGYFFDEIKRISAPNYIPSFEDVLFCRHRTTGVVDKIFVIKGTQLRVFDVGGQRAERKKWIHCFEHVTGVIFVAALSGYDEVMYEEETENVMHDSLNLFGEVCNNQWFTETSMILFLNKKDLFEEKIRLIPLTECFADYDGDGSHDDGLMFIKQKFAERNEKGEQRQIYIHITCATDQRNVERVFNDVQHIVIEDSLDAGGLL
mmetsp:Transcript_37009/g.60888  ORF Transcript_37009/g.60888 Transcript_37009/m.60888 type:complete len:359 (-) Transcript_37009:248-1324(-)